MALRCGRRGGATEFCSRRERYLAEVPKWVTFRSRRRRGMERLPWGWKGEPS